MFKIFTDRQIKTCQSLVPFSEEPMLFLFSWKRNLYEKAFPLLRQKLTQILLQDLLKGATIHFYCLFDFYIFQTSVLIMEWIELNWACKHMKKIRSSQPAIPVPNRVKHQFSSVSIVNQECLHTDDVIKRCSAK